jgi:hypothetical protein
MIDINNYFGDLGLLSGLVTIITGYLNTHVPFLKNANGTIKQLVSWAVAILVVFVGQLKAVGMVAELNTLWTAITGVAVGLIANGIFDINLVKAILSFIKANKTEKKA